MHPPQSPASGASSRLVRSPSRRLFLGRTTALSLAGGSAALLLATSGRGADTPKQAAREGRNARNQQRDEFESIQRHENDHVAFLVQALGASARPKPTFQGLEAENFPAFVQLAQALENTGVGAYLGAAPLFTNGDFLAAAGTILAVEARHAGYVNSYVNDPLTGNAADEDADPSFETPLTPDQVVAGAGGFIADLNGGPPVTYSNVPSAQNDIDILNFALALEYLEAEFYNINVPRFYKSRRR